MALATMLAAARSTTGSIKPLVATIFLVVTYAPVADQVWHNVLESVARPLVARPCRIYPELATSKADMELLARIVLSRWHGSTRHHLLRLFFQVRLPDLAARMA